MSENLTNVKSGKIEEFQTEDVEIKEEPKFFLINFFSLFFNFFLFFLNQSFLFCFCLFCFLGAAPAAHGGS